MDSELLLVFEECLFFFIITNAQSCHVILLSLILAFNHQQSFFKKYFRFSHTNPLHQDVFKSVAHMEAEVVAMTAALLGSKEKSSGGQICGNMTSGGTESILLAVKTSRDYMRSKKGITKPEM